MKRFLGAKILYQPKAFSRLMRGCYDGQLVNMLPLLQGPDSHSKTQCRWRAAHTAKPLRSCSMTRAVAYQ